MRDFGHYNCQTVHNPVKPCTSSVLRGCTRSHRTDAFVFPFAILAAEPPSMPPALRSPSQPVLVAEQDLFDKGTQSMRDSNFTHLSHTITARGVEVQRPRSRPRALRKNGAKPNKVVGDGYLLMDTLFLPRTTDQEHHFFCLPGANFGLFLARSHHAM